MTQHVAAGPRHAWVDASAGVSGDMLLAALVDAGADVEQVRRAVTSVAPGVDVTVGVVRRAGLRALRVDVVAPAEQQPHRSWAQIRSTLHAAPLTDGVKRDATAVFQRLAEAEGAVHGRPAEDVEFHEVGAWDSIGDIVGACAAVHALGIGALTCGPIAVGSGTVDTAHGPLPVPAPAVLELVRGWEVVGRAPGELATPTGAALVTTLAVGQRRLPRMRVTATGTGAGRRDPGSHPNVLRVVLGEPVEADPEGAPWTVLETNVDDLDPRVWPAVLQALLEAGAGDAWLSPAIMKKGRPAHTLHVLAPRQRRALLRGEIFRHTSTLGIREHEVTRPELDRRWVPVDVEGERVRVKVAGLAGRIVHAAAEYDEVAEVAQRRGRPVRELLELATAAAVRAGLVAGAAMPDA